MQIVLCSELEEELRAMLGWFVEVCRRRGMKVNAGKSKVMVMNGEEGLECEVHVDGIRFRACLRIQIFGMSFRQIRYKWDRM